MPDSKGKTPTYDKSQATTDRRQSNYCAFWGRKPDLVLHSSAEEMPHIDVFRFPPIRRKWSFRRVFAAVPGEFAYITGGMSDLPMPAALDSEPVPSRVELTAFSGELVLNETKDMDLVAWWLSFLAHMPFREQVFFGPGHTISTEEPLVPDSQMSGFFFGVTPHVEMRRLCNASVNAQLMLHVFPITEQERALAEKGGSEKLIDLFEKEGIEPSFDFYRASTV